MNDENIAALIIELDKLASVVPAGNTFTSEWLEQEYSGVTAMRDQGKPSYRNEYRIVKILIEARTKVLSKISKDKLALFIPSFKIIRDIENTLKEEFNSRQLGKQNTTELEMLAETSR